MLLLLLLLQVSAACFERCINTENRSETALRADLAEWITLSHSPFATTAACTGTGISAQAKCASTVYANTENARFAMMALHSVRSLKSSSFGSAYRALCGGDER